MKKTFILSLFVAVIIISAIVCIAVGYHTKVISSATIGFIIALVISRIFQLKNKHSVKNMFLIGIGIGAVLITLCYPIASFLTIEGVASIFLCSVLGSVFGCMYPYRGE